MQKNSHPSSSKPAAIIQRDDPDFELVLIAQKKADCNTAEAEEAFITLYNKYFSVIYGFFYNKTSSPADSEDLTSETFFQTIGSLSDFQGRSSFKNWLFGIAKLLLIKFLQKKYQNQNLFEENLEKASVPPEFLDEIDRQSDKNSSSQEEKEYQENLTLISKTLARLPEKYRQVLEHRFLKNMSVNETAEALQLSPQNVKVIQHRALKKANSIKA